MRKFLICYVGLMLLAVSVLSETAGAQNDRLKPLWLKKAPESMSRNVEFVSVTVYSNDSQALPATALGALADRLPSDWNVSRYVSAEEDDDVRFSLGNTDGTSVQTGKIKVTADGGNSMINCALVDDYREVTNGVIRYNALYQVARTEDTPFLETVKTYQYGTRETLLSIVPGLGQFHKGDPLKGGLFLGGCALGTIGIAVTETQRQAYVSQMSQVHDASILRQLDARQKNMGVARNICIGATAAVYLWNLIDAAVAPGARRIVITGNSIQYNF